MNSAAPSAAAESSTRYTAHTQCGDRFPTAEITSRPTIWIIATPILPPPAFTVGNAGRNIVTGPGIAYSQISAQKNFPFKERWNLQFRFDFQNPFHNWGFNNPTNTVDFKNPQLFGKITGDQTTASFAGEPLMNLMLRLTW